jgi:tetratricopeptide (TPR) repeat protein
MPVAEPVAEAPPAVETAESWLTRARQLQEAEEFEASLDEYARLVRAEQYLNEAAEDLEAIVPQLATNIRVRRLLGDCYMRQDRLQEALDTYRGALSLL